MHIWAVAPFCVHTGLSWDILFIFVTCLSKLLVITLLTPPVLHKTLSKSHHWTMIMLTSNVLSIYILLLLCTNKLIIAIQPSLYLRITVISCITKTIALHKIQGQEHCQDSFYFLRWCHIRPCLTSHFLSFAQICLLEPAKFLSAYCKIQQLT